MKKMKGFLMLALAAVGTLLTACDKELDVKTGVCVPIGDDACADAHRAR